MGTSASSNGPGSGVSLDPPWLDDIDESTSKFAWNNSIGSRWEKRTLRPMKYKRMW